MSHRPLSATVAIVALVLFVVTYELKAFVVRDLNVTVAVL
jgi:hypothetical protein